MALPPMANPAARLLDFSQPMDVPLLDATVAAFYGAGSTEEVCIYNCCSMQARPSHLVRNLVLDAVLLAGLLIVTPPPPPVRHTHPRTGLLCARLPALVAWLLLRPAGQKYWCQLCQPCATRTRGRDSITTQHARQCMCSLLLRHWSRHCQ